MRAADAAESIATAAEVVDLLVCLATIAVKSPRNNLIFDPFPTAFGSSGFDLEAVGVLNAVRVVAEPAASLLLALALLFLLHARLRRTRPHPVQA